MRSPCRGSERRLIQRKKWLVAGGLVFFCFLINYSLIKKLIREEKHPFLTEITSQGITRYAVGIGFLQWGEERFVLSLLPEVGEDKVSWRLYFFRWQTGYDEFKLYRIYPRRGF